MYGTKGEFDIVKRSITGMVTAVIIALISIVFSFVVIYSYAQDEAFISHQKRIIQDQFNLKKVTINYKVKSDVETPASIARSMITNRTYDNKYHIAIFYDIKGYEKEISRNNGLTKGTILKPGQIIKLSVFVEKSK